jgi:hypothetical protein
MTKSYICRVQLRASGNTYKPGDSVPGNLDKVNYGELVDRGYITEVAAPAPAPTSTTAPKTVKKEEKLG